MKLRERVSRRAAADSLGVSLRTMRRWEERGLLPKPTKVGEGNGARYFYDAADLQRSKAVVGE